MSSLSRIERINKLFGIYIDIISCDHHKSKDGYWEISYNHYSRKWHYAHDGYVNNFHGEADSYEEALLGLEKGIRRMLSETFDDWRRMLLNPNEYDIIFPANMKQLEREVNVEDS